MFIREHIPHFRARQIEKGWVVDAINRQGFARQLRDIYPSKLQAKSVAAELNEALPPNDPNSGFPSQKRKAA